MALEAAAQSVVARGCYCSVGPYSPALLLLVGGCLTVVNHVHILVRQVPAAPRCWAWWQVQRHHLQRFSEVPSSSKKAFSFAVFIMVLIGLSTLAEIAETVDSVRAEVPSEFW